MGNLTIATTSQAANRKVLALAVLLVALGMVLYLPLRSAAQEFKTPSAAATQIYWAERAKGQILRGNADGSGTPSVLVGSQDDPHGVAVDAVNGKLYWVERGADRIWIANLDGGSKSIFQSGLDRPDRLAIDQQGGKIYWTENGSNQRIRRVNLDGSGSIETILSNLASPVGVAIDTVHDKVYWTEFDSNSVWRATLTGGSKEKLVPQDVGTNPLDISLDVPGNKMYWISGVTGNVYWANLDGSSLAVWNHYEEPRAIVVDPDGGKVYWGSHGTSKIRRSNLNNSGIETLFEAGDGVEEPLGLALYAGSTGPSCYSLNISRSPSAGGTVNASPDPNCGSKYTDGTQVTLTAVSNSGYNFTTWSGANATSSNPIILSLTSEKSITANFTEVVDCYSLSVSRDPLAGGDVEVSPSANCDGTKYTSGTVVTLTAHPISGYSFSNWSGDVTGTGDQKTLSMSSDKSVTAHFTKDAPCFNLAITVSPANGGDVISSPPPDCAGGQFSSGTLVTLTAFDGPDYHFNRWTGSITSSDNPTSVFIDDNKSVTAEFTPATPCYTLSLSHGGSGIDPIATPASSAECPTGKYVAGQSISLQASPSNGWRLSGWIGTDNNSSTATTNSVTMPANNHSARVNYETIVVVSFFGYMPQIVNLAGAPPKCYIGPDERELNNGPAQSVGPLCANSIYTGLPNDGYDFFYWELTQPGRIEVTVTNHVGEEVQLLLYYQSVSSATLIAYDNNQKNGLHLVYETAAPGKYYFQIGTGVPKPQSTEKYSLQVSFP